GEGARGVPRPFELEPSRTRRGSAPLPSPWLPLRRRPGGRPRRAARLAQELSVETPLPLAELYERSMIREIEMERRQRDVAVVHRAHVGAVQVVPARLAAADPVVTAPTRVGL